MPVKGAKKAKASPNQIKTELARGKGKGTAAVAASSTTVVTSELQNAESTKGVNAGVFNDMVLPALEAIKSCSEFWDWDNAEPLALEADGNDTVGAFMAPYTKDHFTTSIANARSYVLFHCRGLINYGVQRLL